MLSPTTAPEVNLGLKELCHVTAGFMGNVFWQLRCYQLLPSILTERDSPLSLSLLLSQRIKDGSVVDRVKVISVGDHIECINGKNIVGSRHYEVARMLKELPRDQAFTLKLVEPMKAFGEWARLRLW